jgi:magnesium transporter
MQDNTSTAEVARYPSVLAAELAKEHVADIAEILNEQSTKVASEVLTQLPLDRAVGVLDQPELESSADLIATLPDDRATAILSGMSADREVPSYGTETCRDPCGRRGWLQPNDGPERGPNLGGPPLPGRAPQNSLSTAPRRPGCSCPGLPLHHLERIVV